MKEIDYLLREGYALAVKTDDNGDKTVVVAATPSKPYDKQACQKWLAVVTQRQPQAVDYFEYLCKYPLTPEETRRAFDAAILGNNTWVDDATFVNRYTGQTVSVPTPQDMYNYTNGYPGPVPDCRIATFS